MKCPGCGCEVAVSRGRIWLFIEVFLLLVIVGVLVFYVVNLYEFSRLYEVKAGRAFLGELTEGFYDPSSGVICQRADVLVAEDAIRFHEVCHYLVDDDYYHFCVEYYPD